MNEYIQKTEEMLEAWGKWARSPGVSLSYSSKAPFVVDENELIPESDEVYIIETLVLQAGARDKAVKQALVARYIKGCSARRFKTLPDSPDCSEIRGLSKDKAADCLKRSVQAIAWLLEGKSFFADLDENSCGVSRHVL